MHQRHIDMLKWIIRNRLGAFEKRYGYDMSYAREILDESVAVKRASSV